MTPQEFLRPPPPRFFAERFWIWLTGIAFTGVGLAVIAVLTPVGAHVVTIWESPTKMAEGLAVIEGQLKSHGEAMDAIRDDLRHAAGEDRVIRQLAGLSYVEEPVYEGQVVTMIMVAARTERGRDCRLTEWTPLFTDEGGITVPGEPAKAGPVSRQINDEQTRLRIEMRPPESLTPGRIALHLALTYDCAGTRVYDQSDPVIYQLLGGPPPT